MSNSCKDCQQPISWDWKERERLGTKRPLNPSDGTIHSCNSGGGRTFRGKAIAPPNESNPTSAVTKEAIPIKQQEMTIEELTEEFQTLAKHMVEFLQQQANK
jgi:hypothetical protein